MDGTLFCLGCLGPITISTIDPLVGRKRLASAGSGGHHYTQDLLDFCGEHNIVADIEIIAPRERRGRPRRPRRSEVRHRFVLDLSTFGDDTLVS